MSEAAGNEGGAAPSPDQQQVPQQQQQSGTTSENPNSSRKSKKATSPQNANSARRKKPKYRSEPSATHPFTLSQNDKKLKPIAEEELIEREKTWRYTTTIDTVDRFQASRLQKLQTPGETLRKQPAPQPGSARKPGREFFIAKEGAAMWLELQKGHEPKRPLSPVDDPRGGFHVPPPTELPTTFEGTEGYRLPKLHPVSARGTSSSKSPSRSPRQRSNRPTKADDQLPPPSARNDP